MWAKWSTILVIYSTGTILPSSEVLLLEPSWHKIASIADALLLIYRINYIFSHTFQQSRPGTHVACVYFSQRAVNLISTIYLSLTSSSFSSSSSSSSSTLLSCLSLSSSANSISPCLLFTTLPLVPSSLSTVLPQSLTSPVTDGGLTVTTREHRSSSSHHRVTYGQTKALFQPPGPS